MSSQTDFIILLSSIQISLYRIDGPILALIGIIGVLVNLIVFTQKNRRKNPCAIYFIVYNISNFLCICTTQSAIILDLGYKITPSSYNLIYCRFRSYFIFLFESLSTIYLLFASIDRVLITSSKCFDTSTKYMFFSFEIYLLYYNILNFISLSYAFALIDIIQTGLNSFTCYLRSGWYSVFVGSYSIIKGILIPLLLLIFVILTVKNIRNIRHIVPVNTSSSSRNISVAHVPTMNTRDKQFIIMLLIDIIVIVMFLLPYSIMLMYQQITQYQIKSLEQIQIELFNRYVISFTAYIPFCVSCYTHLLVLKIFRMTVKNILSCI